MASEQQNSGQMQFRFIFELLVAFRKEIEKESSSRVLKKAPIIKVMYGFSRFINSACFSLMK